MKWMPGAMRMYRAKLFWERESTFLGWHIESGEKLRQTWTKEATEYIRSNAPTKYQDALVPKTVVGCLRRVNDTDYLLCLHQENVELVYDDPVSEIIEDGVRTKSGRLVRADAIILATGFETHKFLFPMEIRGENGISLNEHVKPPIRLRIDYCSGVRSAMVAPRRISGRVLPAFQTSSF